MKIAPMNQFVEFFPDVPDPVTKPQEFESYLKEALPQSPVAEQSVNHTPTDNTDISYMKLGG